MDVAPEVQQLAANLAASLARNGAQMVVDRVRQAKASGRQEDTISQLEEIITELTEDKNNLARISQAYQAELIAQRLTPGDVKYITDTVVPLVEQLAGLSGTDSADVQRLINLLRPLLSVETVNILQMLGFNFRRAVGEPLTELVRRSIVARSAPEPAVAERLQELNLQRETAYLQIALDPDAFARLQTINAS